ncbi:MAG: hypothetical protein HQK67_06665, partial [Desulfamplus sp.]|nr:hypothetical protein [Desulfamplus sp.]
MKNINLQSVYLKKRSCLKTTACLEKSTRIGKSVWLKKFSRMKKSVWVANVVPILVAACLILISCFLPAAYAYAEPLKIAILPFEINAEQNLDFLKNGIQDMLTSRLSYKNEVKVIDKEIVQRTAGSIKGFTGESFALLVGGQLKADFVINGSVTVIGNSTSIDSKLIDVSGKNPPISFFRQSADPGGVIPAINQFATTINETIFNRTSNVAVTGTDSDMPLKNIGSGMATTTSSMVPAGGTQSQQSETTNNNQGVSYSGGQADSGSQTETPNPAFSVNNNSQKVGDTWRSQTFKHLINGIAVGDTDRDNIIETVFISDHNLYIYRFSNSRFIKTAEPVKSRLSTYIGVDTGDINKNGVEEIFVTSLNPDKNMPNSFVVEYDGNKYVNIVKNSPWYFRVIETKGEGKILLGQKQASNRQNIHASPIYRMRWDGDGKIYLFGVAEKVSEFDPMIDDDNDKFYIGGVFKNETITAG